MRILAMLACVMLCANAFAECTTNARGAVVCNNAESAAGYNRNTGNGFTSQKNENGVTTTQTTKGGEAKTKDGKGVYTSPSGKTCAKTARHQGCN